jgi:hypothetical protein
MVHGPVILDLEYFHDALLSNVFGYSGFILGAAVAKEIDIVAFRPLNAKQQYHSVAFLENMECPPYCGKTCLCANTLRRGAPCRSSLQRAAGMNGKGNKKVSTFNINHTFASVSGDGVDITSHIAYKKSLGSS